MCKACKEGWSQYVAGTGAAPPVHHEEDDHKASPPRLMRPRGRAERVEPPRPISTEGKIVAALADEGDAPIFVSVSEARHVQGFRLPTAPEREERAEETIGDDVAAPASAAPVVVEPAPDAPIEPPAVEIPAAPPEEPVTHWGCPECGTVAEAASTCASCGFTATDTRAFLPAQTATPLNFVFGRGTLATARVVYFLVMLTGVALIGFVEM